MSSHKMQVTLVECKKKFATLVNKVEEDFKSNTLAYK